MTLQKDYQKILNLKTYSVGEEIANSVTHGIGALLSLIGLIVLVNTANHSGDLWRVVSFSVFGGSMLLLYLASTLYHSIQAPRVKFTFKKIDHIAIYILIAGSYTPFTLVSFRGSVGWTMFGIIWGIAVIGIIYKIFFIGRWRRFSTILYLGMGWIAVAAIQQMLETVEMEGLLWMAAGGLFYTSGVIFYVWKKLPYHHAIWHGFVMGGSACHYIAILYYV